MVPNCYQMSRCIQKAQISNIKAAILGIGSNYALEWIFFLQKCGLGKWFCCLIYFTKLNWTLFFWFKPNFWPKIGKIENNILTHSYFKPLQLTIFLKTRLFEKKTSSVLCSKWLYEQNDKYEFWMVKHFSYKQFSCSYSSINQSQENLI